MMKILNTMSGQKEEFTHGEEGEVKMFVCGPTVYDYMHIGNARTFVFFDVVAKYLRYRGYDVDYIQNITDIDDKIINRAKQENKTWKEAADFYFEKFKEDAEALGITGPRYAKATDYIEEVKKQVKTLVSKGNVYLINGDGWYFDLKTFSEYGKLSGRTSEMADDAVSRIDESESKSKRNKGDFVVWKLVEKSEAGYWDDNELGYGRPGWHIEDTAITEREFGPRYDIHGGGQDLIFPHHEAEISQQCSAANIKPKDFVRYWMHVGFVMNPAPSKDGGADKERKMSKSLGNFITARELLRKYSEEVLRFYLLSGHYRSPLDYSDKILKQSAAAIQRISEFKRALEKTDDKVKNIIENIDINESERKFFSALDEDFNIPEALGYLFSLIRTLNPLLRMGAVSQEYAQPILEFLNKIDTILGIIPIEYESAPSNVIELVAKREKLREENNYEEADKIRAQIEYLGYKIEDTAYGPLVVSRPS